MTTPAAVHTRAQELLTALPSLVDSDTAANLQTQLTPLLTQSPTTTTMVAILSLVSQDETLKHWFNASQPEELADLVTIRYAPLAGSRQIAAFQIYRCPEPDCTHRWPRRDAGQEIPHCPTHHQLLILETKPATTP